MAKRWNVKIVDDFVDIGMPKYKCPFHKVWRLLMKRTQDVIYKSEHNSLIDNSCCDLFLRFSDFKVWMKTQDWEGKVLDKDLLGGGLKFYSPETCVFIPKYLNNAIQRFPRGRNLMGVEDSYKGLPKKYKAIIADFTTKKNVNLGYFDSEEDAHRAWQEAKVEYFLTVLKYYKLKNNNERVEEGINKIILRLKNDIEKSLPTFEFLKDR